MDLANAIVRETYRGNKSKLSHLTARQPGELRLAIATAKRFVLDDSMSDFLGELATVPFRVAAQRQIDTLESLRHSARLPFPKMFIQYNNRAFRKGLVRGSENKTDFWGQSLLPNDSTEITPDIGWLIEHDNNDTELVWITEFMSDDEFDVLAVPVRFAYRTDDNRFTPAQDVDEKLGVFAHGLMSEVGLLHLRQPIGIQILPAYKNMSKKDMVEVRSDNGEKMVIPRIIPEFGGVVRYVLAFLATLNNVPKIETQVRPQKGFLGGGQIRKYMDYTTLTLKLPARTTKVNLAMRLIAKARMGWHEVRPHWRIQVAGTCKEEHIWSAKDSSGHAYCMNCNAKRVWIVLPSGRGDPTIAVRTHKYVVTHPEN